MEKNIRNGSIGLLSHVGPVRDPVENKRRQRVNLMVDEYNRTVHTMPPDEQLAYQERVSFLRDRLIADLDPGPIRDESEYDEYLEWVDALMGAGVSPQSPIGEKVKAALLMIKQYEDKHHPIPNI